MDWFLDDRISLESDSIVGAKPRRSHVSVHHVKLESSALEVAPRRLVKFSKTLHTIPEAAHVQLATPRYYRNIEESDAQIRDELEARYIESRRAALSERGFRGAYDLNPWAKLEVTYSTDGLWIFCASVAPSPDAGIERLRERFGAEAATIIQTPSEFARELGSGVAASVLPDDIETELLAPIARAALLPPGVSNVVSVHHGPVYYTDRVAEFLDEVPLLERPTVLPFIKRQAYAWQREYRFTVAVIGSPKEDTYRFPIHSGLRDLTWPWAAA